MELRIYHVPDLDGNPTPARCNRRTGEIWINDSVWYKIPPAHRMFILLHEYGHIALDSSDELEVDEFASKLYIQMGYSLNESVKSLSSVLSGKSPQHTKRVRNQLNRALEADKKNQTMCNTSLSNNCDCAGCNSNFTGEPTPWWNLTPDDNFGGCDAGKLRPRQYRKCVKAEGKATAKVAKAEGRKALQAGKGAGLQAKGEAKRILGEQGIVDSNDDGLKGIVKTVARVAGGGEAGEPAPANNTGKILMWVGIAVGVLAIGVTLVLVLVKRKK